MKTQTDAQRHEEMKRQCSTLTRKVDAALARQRQTEAERDKAEQALRSVTHELAQARSRLRFLEAELASLRPGRVDDS